MSTRRVFHHFSSPLISSPSNAQGISVTPRPCVLSQSHRDSFNSPNFPCLPPHPILLTFTHHRPFHHHPPSMHLLFPPSAQPNHWNTKCTGSGRQEIKVGWQSQWTQWAWAFSVSQGQRESWKHLKTAGTTMQMKLYLKTIQLWIFKKSHCAIMWCGHVY